MPRRCQFPIGLEVTNIQIMDSIILASIAIVVLEFRSPSFASMEKFPQKLTGKWRIKVPGSV
jgi:hypothetical protein